MNQTDLVQENYNFRDFSARVEDALIQAGFGTGQIPWSALAGLDQFHVRGLMATQELADGLGLIGGETVLDVGCGLGGPARYLAATYGCHVTGIDLTPSYIVVSEMLGRRTGLSDHLTFVPGDALELPFPPDSFDHVWTQHVAMNIEDKARLYLGIYRVLKPGGRFAIYDVTRGGTEPLIYPVPWASEARISFLASPLEMAQQLSAAGFREVSSVDTTDLALAWFAELQRAQPSPGGPNPLSLGSVAGPEVRPMLANFAQNIQEGRVRLMQIIVQKD